MAKMAPEVIEWAQAEAEALESNDTDVLDEDLVAEFLLQNVIKMITDHMETQSHAKASEVRRFCRRPFRAFSTFFPACPSLSIFSQRLQSPANFMLSFILLS